MADVADQLMQQGFESAKGTVQREAASAVVDLASRVQTVRNQRAQLEELKAQMEQAKLSKFVDALEKGKAFEGAARNNYYRKFMPRLRDSLGLTEQFPDDALQFMTADGGNINRMSYIIGKVRRGEMTSDEALSFFNDPVKAATLPGYSEGMFSAPTESEMKQLTDAEEFALTQQGLTQRNREDINAAYGKQQREFGAVGKKAADVDIGKNYSAYVTEGGQAGLDSNIAEITEVLNQLKTGVKKTRNFASFIPTDYAQKLFNEDALALQSRMHKAIQSSLRATLGSQFTQEEGNRILNNTFDPKLSTEINIQRLEAELHRINETRRTAESTFRANKHQLPPDASEQLGDASAAGGKNTAPPPPSLAQAQKIARKLREEIAKSGPRAVAAFRRQAQQRGLSPEQIRNIETLAQGGGQ